MPDYEHQIKDACLELEGFASTTLSDQVVEVWRLGLERGRLARHRGHPIRV